MSTTKYKIRSVIATIALVSSFLCLNLIFGQGTEPSSKLLFGKPISKHNHANGTIRCATVEYEKFLLEKNPQRTTEEQFESWIKPLLVNYKTRSSVAKSAATVLTIPVVVHVIHAGQAVGTAPNTTNAQVESQITVLNQDFRKKLGTPGGTSTNPKAADIEIEFVLAKVDPEGNPTNGINRVNMGRSSWSDEDIDAILKPATIWNPRNYLNMWSVRFSDDKLLGYAQFPDTSGLSGLNRTNGDAITDGVVASFDVFGSNDFGSTFILAAPYNKGRTMTHEVGHFLGLRHIWGDGNGDQESGTADCVASDFCADTPQAGWANYNCKVPYDTCPVEEGLDMVENYMDYTNDACMNIFTQDQKARIITVMNNSQRRASLKTSKAGIAIPLFVNDGELKIETDYTIKDRTDCSSLQPPANKKVLLTNRGTAVMTSALIWYSIAGGANQNQIWTGSLMPNQTVLISLLNTAFNGILNASIQTVNGVVDQRTSNNGDIETFSPANYTFTNYTFNLQQDFWGSEISWELKDDTGTTIYQGGPYTDATSTRELPALLSQNWTLVNNKCYTFTIYDSENDGICCFGGNGFYTITSTDATTTIASGANFGNKESTHFTTNTLSRASIETSNDIYLYPNPANEVVSIYIPNQYGLPQNLTIYNSLGQVITQKKVAQESDLKVNTASLSNGIYFITIDKNNQSKTLQFVKE